MVTLESDGALPDVYNYIIPLPDNYKNNLKRNNEYQMSQDSDETTDAEQFFKDFAQVVATLTDKIPTGPHGLSTSHSPSNILLISKKKKRKTHESETVKSCDNDGEYSKWDLIKSLIDNGFKNFQEAHQDHKPTESCYNSLRKDILYHLDEIINNK